MSSSAGGSASFAGPIVGAIAVLVAAMIFVQIPTYCAMGMACMLMHCSRAPQAANSPWEHIAPVSVQRDKAP